MQRRWTQRSDIGFVIEYRGSILSLGSVRESTVAMLTYEPECRAISHALKARLWLRRLLLTG
jgi:hypothetical protein